MEVVLSACALSQMALYFINRYSKRRPHIAATPSTRQNGDEKGQIVEEREEEETDVVSTVEPLEEGSIAALEAKLKSLRTEAKLLTSPDSFVQYAKVSREANKVEKVLKQKKGVEQGDAPDLPIDNIMKMVSGLLMPKASSVIRKHASIMMMKMAVRLCLVLGLYIYFSWYQEDENRGVAMTIDCQAFRPISFLFRRQTPLCFEGDWNCVAQLPETIFHQAMFIENLPDNLPIKPKRQMGLDNGVY